MNVKLRSVHTLKKVLFNSLGLKRRILIGWALWGIHDEYSLYFALYGIHDFRTLNTELRTAKSKRSKKALLRSHALRTKAYSGTLSRRNLRRLWAI